MELLEFIFRDWWTFFGVIVLWMVMCVGLALVVSELPRK